MKQRDVVVGHLYLLARMQYLGKEDLNGVVVRVVGKKERSKQEQNWAGFKTGRRLRSNVRYLTDIALRWNISAVSVGATNLEQWQTTEQEVIS